MVGALKTIMMTRQWQVWKRDDDHDNGGSGDDGHDNNDDMW